MVFFFFFFIVKVFLCHKFVFSISVRIMCVCVLPPACALLCVPYICSSDASAWLSGCLRSLLHPTRLSCLLFMGTRTAGHPSRAFSQWDTHNIWACCHTLARCSRERHTLSWPFLICFLLCCCVSAPSGYNSRSGLLVQMRLSSRFSLLLLRYEQLFIVMALAKLVATAPDDDDFHPFFGGGTTTTQRLWWMVKGESFCCSSHNLLVQQSRPDSSNEKMINRPCD